MLSGANDHEVTKILDERVNSKTKRKEYRVLWATGPPSWVPESYLTKCELALDVFMKSKKIRNSMGKFGSDYYKGNITGALSFQSVIAKYEALDNLIRKEERRTGKTISDIADLDTMTCTDNGFARSMYRLREKEAERKMYRESVVYGSRSPKLPNPSPGGSSEEDDVDCDDEIDHAGTSSVGGSDVTLAASDVSSAVTELTEFASSLRNTDYLVRCEVGSQLLREIDCLPKTTKSFVSSQRLGVDAISLAAKREGEKAARYVFGAMRMDMRSVNEQESPKRRFVVGRARRNAVGQYARHHGTTKLPTKSKAAKVSPGSLVGNRYLINGACSGSENESSDDVDWMTYGDVECQAALMGKPDKRDHEKMMRGAPPTMSTHIRSTEIHRSESECSSDISLHSLSPGPAHEEQRITQHFEHLKALPIDEYLRNLSTTNDPVEDDLFLRSVSRHRRQTPSSKPVEDRLRLPCPLSEVSFNTQFAKSRHRRDLTTGIAKGRVVPSKSFCHNAESHNENMPMGNAAHT